MPKQENITTAFKLDISEFKQGITEANKQIKLANAQFNSATAEMDDWAESTDGLKAKIKQLTSIVDAQESKLTSYTKQLDAMREAQDKNKKKTDDLKQAIADASAEYGENSTEVKKLKKSLSDVEKEMASNEKAMDNLEVTILNQKASVGKAKKELGNYEDELEDVGKASDEAEEPVEDLGGSFDTVKVAVGNLIAEGISALIGALGDAIEDTKEFRKEMGLLETVADENKVAFDKVSETYGKLLATRGDEGAVTETLNNLLTAGFDESNLESVAEGIEGLAIRFKDTLSQEGIADSIQEWIGSDGANLTGNFAEALERMGYNLEDVQAKTKGLSDEQREQWVISTLAKEGLNDVSKAYRENNASLIESSDASFKMTQAMSGIAESVEPIATAFTSGFADVLLTLQDLFDFDFSGITDGIKTAFSTIVGLLKGDLSLSDVLTDVFSKVQGLIPKVTQIGSDLISNLVKSFTDNLPKFLEKGSEIIGKIGEGIKKNLPTLVSKALDIITSLSESLYNNFPTILQSGISLLRNLVQGIMDSLPELIAKVPTIVSNIANTINDNAFTIIKAGFDIILDIIKGIINAIPTLVANIPKIIKAMIDVWTATNWLNLGTSAITKIGTGITNMFGSIKTIGTNLFNNFWATVKGLPGQMLTLGQNLMSQLGSAITTGITTLKTNAGKIVTTILNSLGDLPSKVFEIGKNLVEGLWNGISGMADWVGEKISGFTDGVLEGIKDFFGINSPSKETAWIGEMLGEGVGVGITDSIASAVKSAKNLSNDVLGTLNGGLDAMNVNTGSVGAVSGGQVVNFNQTINSPKAVDRLTLYQNTKSLMFSAKGRLQHV